MLPYQERDRGLPLKICVLWTIVLALAGCAESIVPAAEKDKVDRGLEAGKEILGFIKDKDFTKTLTKIAASTAPFLGAIGPFIGFLLAFIPAGDSDELKFMKDMMKKIDNKFNEVDSRFNELERLINWVQVAVNFGQIQQNIKAMHAEYRSLYAGAGTVSVNKKDDFITQYESVYQLGGLKLYQAIVENHGTFTENLGRSVMRYTKNDRKKTQDFLLGILELLYEASEIEMAYYAAKQFDNILADRKTTWVNRFNAVKRNYEEIDRAVRDKFQEQTEADMREFSSKMYGQSNEKFVKDSYAMLKKKYYWRDWCIVAYNLGTASTANYCGGVRLFNQDGRHFVVSSVESTKSKMSLATMRSRLESIGSYAYTKNWLGQKSSRNTNEVFDRIDKSGTCSTIVMHRNNGAWYIADPGRFVYVALSPWQDLYMFA